MIHSKYGNPYLAERNLELVLSAMIESELLRDPLKLDAEWVKAAEAFSQFSYQGLPRPRLRGSGFCRFSLIKHADS